MGTATEPYVITYMISGLEQDVSTAIPPGESLVVNETNAYLALADAR